MKAADKPAPRLGPNHKDGCKGESWRYSGSGYNRVRLCACGAEDHAPDWDCIRMAEVAGIHNAWPAPLPEQAPVSPGMGKGEGEKCWTCGGMPNPSGRECICGNTGSHVEEVANMRAELLGFGATIPVPRETLQRVVASMEAVIKDCAFDPDHAYDTGGPTVGTLDRVRAALAELRGLMEGE